MGLFDKLKKKEKVISVEIVASGELPYPEATPVKTAEDELMLPFIEAYGNFLRRPWLLALEFPHSSSRALSQIRKLAETMRGFTETQNSEGYPLYQVSFRPLEIGDFEQLYKKVKNWKGTLLYVNGEIVSQADVSKWIICYRDKVKYLESQPLFCWGASTFTNNIFGCHRTKIRDSDWNWNQCWYSIGELDNEGTFHIDKRRIVSLIRDNIRPYCICPALNPAHLALGLKIIPDTINARKDKIWEYVQLSDGSPVGVRPIRRGHVVYGTKHFDAVMHGVPNTPQFDDLMSLLEHKLRMGAIEIF